MVRWRRRRRAGPEPDAHPDRDAVADTDTDTVADTDPYAVPVADAEPSRTAWKTIWPG